MMGPAPYPVELAGWVLVQSAWQGAALYGVHQSVRAILRRRGPVLRYHATLLALAALALLPLATAMLADRSAVAAAVFRGTHPGPVTSHWHWERIASVLCGIWIAGAGLGLVTLLAGWHRLHGLIHGGRPSPLLRRRVAALCPESGVRTPPRVRESHAITTPLAAGWRSPVLVLPAGMADELAPGDFDAVIVHELAHIRRHDYAVNLAQRVVESVLWFHPAAWLLSRQLRTERERCCDDAAVAISGHPLPLARALVRLEERCARPPALAVAGGDGHVTERVRRILDGDDRCPRHSVTLALPALAIVVAAAALAWTGGIRARTTLAGRIPVVTITANDPGGAFALRLVRGRALDATLNGSPVPSRRLQQRGSLIRILDPRAGAPLTVRIAQGGRGIEWEPRRPLVP